MKPRFNRLSRLNQIVFVVAAAALAPSAHATDYTYTANANGNWSDATKWDANGIPLSDAANSSVIFSNTLTTNTSLTATIDATWNGTGSGSVTGLAFSSNVTNTNNYLFTLAGIASTNLTLGSGGITNYSGHRVTLFSNTQTLTLADSQTWDNANNWANNNTDQSVISVNAHLSSAAGIVLTKAGVGQLRFDNGNSTNFLGSFTWNAGNVYFGSQAQYGRLGTQTITADFTTATNNPALVFAMNNGETPVTSTWANIVNLTPPPNRSLGFTMGSNMTVGQNLVFSGNWSATIPTNIGNNGAIQPNLGFGTYDDRFRFTFTGDNSGLTSAADPAANNFVFAIRKGFTVADSPTALGVNNALGVGLGENSNGSAAMHAGLLATSGNHVNAKIRVRGNAHPTPRNAYAVIGLDGAGTVDFKGPIILESHNSAANSVETLKLTAPAGGTAVISGNITEITPANLYKAPVLVMGQGSVLLTGNNSYQGTTIVRDGTLLVGSANALGTGSSAISLGDTVTQTTDVVAANNVSMPNVSSFSAGVYTLNTALTSLDGVTLASGDRILYKGDPFNSERNGIYTLSADLKVLTRAADLDDSAEFTMGLRIRVNGGTRNGGKNFYLSSNQSTVAFAVNSTTNGLGSTGFSPDAASNANVALLTDGPVTISRNILVTDNLSAGSSSIGGNSADTSTFSGTITLDRNAKLTAATGGTVNFTNNITGTSAITITKDGPGTVVFPGGFFYGTLNVTDGVLQSDDYVEASSVSVGSGGTIKGIGTIGSALTAAGTIAPGNGTGTLTAGDVTLTGTLAVEIDGTSFDQLVALTASSPTTGKLDISGATLTVTELGGGFTPSGSYVIAKGDSRVGTFASVTPGYAVTYTATEAILTKLSGNDYDTWKTGFGPGFIDTATTSDPDGDGMTNKQEYAFGLNPTLGSSVNPVTVQLDKTTGTFTYTRRKLSLVTPIAYTIKTTTDLATWATDAGAIQNVTGTTGDIETVQVTVSPALLANSKLFVRVSAE